MHRPPRVGNPLVGGAPGRGARVRAGEYQVLEEEELPAVGERSGLRRPPVVGASPRGKYHATVLARLAMPGEDGGQVGDGLAGQRPVKELRFAETVAPAGWERFGCRSCIAGTGGGLIADGLAECQLLA